MSDSISLAGIEALREQFPDANIAPKTDVPTSSSGIKVVKNKASQSTSSVANVAVYEDPSVEISKEKFLKYTCSITITANKDGHDAELRKMQAAVIEFISNLHKTL